MPPINDFKCTDCDFAMPMGSGGYLYVNSNQGEKIVCPHPVEAYTIAKVLGIDEGDILGFPWFPLSESSPINLLKERVGFNSHCVCLDCLAQFDLDVEKEDRACPKCGSEKIRTEMEMVGFECPACKVGTIQEISTGRVS
jgi:hypothetical protein